MTLRKAGGTEEQVKAFKAKCHERLPLAWLFASEEDKAGRKLESHAAPPQEVVANGVKTDV